MSKLYFRYAAMNAGKSTALLQAAYNYEERGMRVLLFTAALDNRTGQGVIGSRLGLQRQRRDIEVRDDDVPHHQRAESETLAEPHPRSPRRPSQRPRTCGSIRS